LLSGIIEGLLKYFNQYAFTQVAIYGKSYCNAGRVLAVPVLVLIMLSSSAPR